MPKKKTTADFAVIFLIILRVIDSELLFFVHFHSLSCKLFIDTYGKSENKEAMKSGWPGYFEWFPDYQIEIEEYLANESCVILIGRASGSYLGQAEKQWAFPAAWKVVAADQQIKFWQVFCDSKKQLDSMK